LGFLLEAAICGPKVVMISSTRVETAGTLSSLIDILPGPEKEDTSGAGRAQALRSRFATLDGRPPPR
jgi:hypothetical protein